jgi:hypothetical protein
MGSAAARPGFNSGWARSEKNGDDYSLTGMECSARITFTLIPDGRFTSKEGESVLLERTPAIKARG